MTLFESRSSPSQEQHLPASLWVRCPCLGDQLSCYSQPPQDCKRGKQGWFCVQLSDSERCFKAAKPTLEGFAEFLLVSAICHGPGIPGTHRTSLFCTKTAPSSTQLSRSRVCLSSSQARGTGAERGWSQFFLCGTKRTNEHRHHSAPRFWGMLNVCLGLLLFCKH